MTQIIEKHPEDAAAGNTLVDAFRPAPSTFNAILSSPRLPFVFAAIVIAVLAYVGLSKSTLGGWAVGGPSVVLFDPVKFANAQRAAVSILRNSPNADLALTMTQVAKHAEAVIREEAGSALILVKQTVVAPDPGMPDITDAVLRRFGLSTEVPSVSIRPGEPSESLQDFAPTDSSFSEGRVREDYLLQLGERNARAAEALETATNQNNILP